MVVLRLKWNNGSAGIIQMQDAYVETLPAFSKENLTGLGAAGGHWEGSWEEALGASFRRRGVCWARKGQPGAEASFRAEGARDTRLCLLSGPLAPTRPADTEQVL